LTTLADFTQRLQRHRGTRMCEYQTDNAGTDKKIVCLSTLRKKSPGVRYAGVLCGSQCCVHM